MPITKSAKKALRQNKKRRKRNLGRSRLLKSGIKKLKKSVEKKDKKAAQLLLPNVYSLIDKAVKTHLLKKNTAGRLKSRLTKSVNKI